MRYVVLAILVAVLVVATPSPARASSRSICGTLHQVGVSGNVLARSGAACGGIAKDVVKPPVPDADRKLGYPVYRWRFYVSKYWNLWARRILGRHVTNAEIHRALVIIKRESGGNWRAVNPRSHCTGLFQLLPGYSRGKYDLRDPRTNCSLAAQLWVRRGWAPWRASAW